MEQNTIRHKYVIMCVCGVCTFSSHAHCQTLLEAAERTTFPLCQVHGAALLLRTGVVLVVLHRALKEALKKQEERGCKNPYPVPVLLLRLSKAARLLYLAALTGEQPIVVS